MIMDPIYARLGLIYDDEIDQNNWPHESANWKSRCAKIESLMDRPDVDAGCKCTMHFKSDL